MDKTTLTEILAQHKLWVTNTGGMCAYLRGAYLQGANLQGVNLQDANLRGADLKDAYLQGANLRGAYLQGANLRGAYLQGAYLQGANLQGVNLQGAYLQGANLQGVNLQDAYLQGANLQGADLKDANLQGAYLQGAEGIPALIAARLSITPAGVLHVWKKCRDNVIVELLIPADAKRSNATGRKCRAEYADVVAVHGLEYGVSLYDDRLEYRVGQRVTCDKWEPDRWVECGGGIHFYLTREEAEAHR